MASNTTNYGWTKPDYEDDADIMVINDIIDNIDTALHEHDEELAVDRAALVELVDNGAKNLINNTAVSTSIFTVNSDGTVLVNGSSGTSNKVLDIEVNERSYPYDTVLSGCPSGGGYVNRYAIYLADTNGNLIILSATTGAADEGSSILIPANTSFKYVRIIVRANQTINNFVFKPMLCSKTAWDISQAYQPYRPSYDEIIARITALENA